jgi:hypothetical protein
MYFLLVNKHNLQTEETDQLALGHKHSHGHNTEVNMYLAVINFKPMTSATSYVAYIMPKKRSIQHIQMNNDSI